MTDRSETAWPGVGENADDEGRGAEVRANPPAAASRFDRAAWAAIALLRRHWVFVLLLAGGVLLRVTAQLGYQPALLFIDSRKYILGATYQKDTHSYSWGAFDPLGYTVLVLRPVMIFANLAVVAALQHLAGLAMASGLYVLMVRRGITRWLAAAAAAPVLLDAYQLQAEQTIMPDVLFETLIVAGLVLLLWLPRPNIGLVILTGFAFGTSATVRQIGEALIAPTLIYIWVAARNWRARALQSAAVLACFAIPIAGYMAYSGFILHNGYELSNMGDAYLYGRTAHAADCATLPIPPAERELCPSPQVAALIGVDGLVNGTGALIHGNHIVVPRELPYLFDAQTGHNVNNTQKLQKNFAKTVLRYQPERVLGDIAKDSVKIFALTRNTEEGDTPISRWQFQFDYPYYPPGIVARGPESANNLFAAAGGGQVSVYKPAARLLRVYQFHGGYTPGPLFLISLLAGLAGIFTYRRRREPSLAFASLMFTATAVAVLLGADLYEFSWRYQLPALVTLPMAGAVGATALARHISQRREARTAGRTTAARYGSAAEKLAAAGYTAHVELPPATAPYGLGPEQVLGSEQVP